MSEAPVIYLTYNSALSPLVESQVIAYLGRLHLEKGLRFQLVSFEPAAVWAQRGSPRLAAAAARLRAQGITWTALRYHSTPSLLATLWDILIGAVVVFWLIRRLRPRLIHARSHVPAAIALLASVGTSLPFLFDCRGLMADEYAEGGHWSPASWKYRLTKWAERILFVRAAAVVVLTTRAREFLITGDRLPRLPPDRVTVIPTCVDLARFPRRDRPASPPAETTICYLGSLGMWYMLGEMLDFVREMRRIGPTRLLVLNQGQHDLVEREVLRHGLRDVTTIVAADAADVPGLLASASAGISFIRPSFSKQASSPTKIGEYLAAGLPVITNPGVGDGEELVGDLGVIVRTFDAAAYRSAADELRHLLADAAIRDRCRQRAADVLSLELGVDRYADVYRRVESRW